MDLHTNTMAELTAGLESGEYTSVELTQALLDRIAAHNDTLNALLTVTAEASTCGGGEGRYRSSCR